MLVQLGKGLVCFLEMIHIHPSKNGSGFTEHDIGVGGDFYTVTPGVKKI
jgi:hypothetical protein